MLSALPELHDVRPVNISRFDSAIGGGLGQCVYAEPRGLFARRLREDELPGTPRQQELVADDDEVALDHLRPPCVRLRIV